MVERVVDWVAGSHVALSNRLVPARCSVRHEAVFDATNDINYDNELTNDE